MLDFANNFYSCNCLTSIKKKQTHHDSWIACLPPELLQLILNYLTKTFQGIIHFSTVCRQWKEIGDHSLLWLTCELSFYCTDDYYRLIAPYSTPSSKKSFGNSTPPLVLFTTGTIHYHADRIKLTFLRPTATVSGEPLLYGTVSPVILPYQQAILIRKRFMSIFIKYHQLWDWYCRWRPWAKNLEEKCRQGFEKFYAKYCFVVGIVTQVAAAYFLSSIENNSSSLSPMNHAGFACLYWYGLSFAALFTVGIIYNFHYELSYPFNNDLASALQLRRIYPFLSIELLIFGFLFSMILFHIKLATGWTSLLYCYVTIPLWICFFTALALSIDWLWKEEINGYFVPIVLFLSAVTIVSIPTGFTTIALFYDSPSHYGISSLHYAVIPLYPAELSAALITALSLFDNCIFLNNIRRGGPFYHNYLTLGPLNGWKAKLVYDGVRSLLLLGMMSAIVYFNVMLVLDSFSLGQAIMTCIVACTLLYLTFYCIILGK